MTQYTCTNCGITKLEGGEATGHTPGEEATCEKGGYTTFTCTKCGDSYVSDETEPLGHDLSAGEKITDSACNHDGVISCSKSRSTV